MSDNTCSRCQSTVAVKLNKHCAGPGSENEYLCRGCRFDVSNIRRSRETQRYAVFFYSAGSRPKHQLFRATDSGDAIKQFTNLYPYAKWDKVYSLTLMRRRV